MASIVPSSSTNTLFLLLTFGAFLFCNVLESSFLFNVTSSSDFIFLHKFLANSYHAPLCVLTADSQLKAAVLNLWSDSRVSGHLSDWNLAVINSTEAKEFPLPNYLSIKSESPQSTLLRCFLGPTFSLDYLSASYEQKSLLQWFKGLVSQHQQLVNASANTVQAAVKQHRFVLLVFPTAHEHEELEQVVFQIGKNMSKFCKIKIFVIHSISANFRNIVEAYSISIMPSVLLIDNNGKEREEMIFNIHDVMTRRLEIDLQARIVPAEHFKLENFQWKVQRVSAGEVYKPLLVGFYAHWTHNTDVFLSMLRLTVDEYSSLGAYMRFGLVDVSRYPEVVSLYMHPTCLQHLPFLALFSIDQVSPSVVKVLELFVTRPSPFTVYEALRKSGFHLIDSNHQWITYQPLWFDDRVCLWSDILRNDTCSADNTTWTLSYDSVFVSNQKDQHEREEKVGKTIIPLASPYDWLTDQINTTIFIKLFIFIHHPCRSCEQNMGTFEWIYGYLSENNSHMVRLVNCSQSLEFCNEKGVSGFPGIVTMRSFRVPALCTDSCANGQCYSTVQQQYHGAFTVESIMKWIQVVSGPAFQSLYFNNPEWDQQAEPAQLVATVLPLNSDYLPRATNADRGYFYNLQCFKVVCENLFGLARCFIAYSTDIPPSQFDNVEEDSFVISEIIFRRGDGIQKRLMQLGHPLLTVLAEDTYSNLHMAYKDQTYNLQSNQKCEDSFAACTLYLQSFTRNHLRLPVTALMSDSFLHHRVFFLKPLPVMVALVEPGKSKQFLKVLKSVGEELYEGLIVTTLDVTVYPAWAGSLVPLPYSSMQPDWRKMVTYPRLCLFFLHNRSQAAFYPPTSSWRSKEEHHQLLSHHLIVQFVRQFIKDPHSCLVATERF